MHSRVTKAFGAQPVSEASPDYQLESPHKRRRTEVELELDATLDQHLSTGGTPAATGDVCELEQRLWEELTLADSVGDKMSMHDISMVAPATSSTAKADILKRIRADSKAQSEFPEQLGIESASLVSVEHPEQPVGIQHDEHLDAMLEEHFDMPSNVEAARGSLELEWQKLVLAGSEGDPTTPERDPVHGETQLTPVEEKFEKPQRKPQELEERAKAQRAAFAPVLQELQGALARPRVKTVRFQAVQKENEVCADHPEESSDQKPVFVEGASPNMSSDQRRTQKDKENIIRHNECTIIGREAVDEPVVQELRWSPTRARRAAPVSSSPTSPPSAVPVEEHTEVPEQFAFAAMLQRLVETLHRMKLTDLLEKVKKLIVALCRSVKSAFVGQPTRKTLVLPRHGQYWYEPV